MSERWGQEHREKGGTDENHLARTELQQGWCNFSGMYFKKLTSSHFINRTSWHWQPPSVSSSFDIFRVDSSLLMDDLLKEVETSFISNWCHFIHSGGFYQRSLVRVEHLIFLSFLSSGQAFFPTWSVSGVFLIRSGRKAKLPICRECHLKENISAFELIQAKFFYYCFSQNQKFWESVIWESLKPWYYLRDVPWMFVLSNWSPLGSSGWQPARGPLISEACPAPLGALIFLAMGQRKILQIDCIDCLAETRKSCCWMNLIELCWSSTKTCFTDISLLPTKVCSTTNTWYNSRITDEIRKK